MANEYADYRCQEAFEAGIREAVEVLEPHEPDEQDRAWFDNQRPFWIHEEDDWPEDRSAVYYTRREMEDMSREDVADALDQQWNGPR